MWGMSTEQQQQPSEMRLPDDTWYSYLFRQVCEKSWAVLAVAGFVVLWWYSEKAEDVQQGIIERTQRTQGLIVQLLQDTIRAQNDQTNAIHALTDRINEMNGRVERIEKDHAILHHNTNP